MAPPHITSPPPPQSTPAALSAAPAPLASPCITHAQPQGSAGAGFAEAVKAANSSPLGRRNGCAVLSMQASEKALLQHLLARLHAVRPDVLVGHNLGAGDLPLLLQHLQFHKVQGPGGCLLDGLLGSMCTKHGPGGLQVLGLRPRLSWVRCKRAGMVASPYGAFIPARCVRRLSLSAAGGGAVVRH